MKKKVFLDTQILEYAATGNISKREWDHVTRYLQCEYRYYISLHTLYELLVGLALGSNDYFSHNQKRLKVLFSLGARRYLGLAGDFVRVHAFGLPGRIHHFDPEHLRIWARVIVGARDRWQLEREGVGLGTRAYGIKLDEVVSQVDRGKAQHVKSLEELRDGVSKRSNQEIWSTSLLNLIEVPATPENVTRILNATDAAFWYSSALYDLAKARNYNFDERDSDWLDYHQLLYLADPTVHFVTAEVKLPARIKKSVQRDRVLVWKDLISIAAKRGF